MTTDFADLPPADINPNVTEPEPVDTLPEGPLCEACGKVIIREPGKRGRMPKWHPECRPKTKAKTGTRRRASKTSQPSYEEGLNGLFQMASFGLLVAAGDHSKELLADSKAVAEHGPGISAALNQLALEKPEVANVLDRILSVGPYGLVIGAVAPLVLQVARNHGAPIPNVAGPDEYLGIRPQPEPAQS